MTARDLSLFEAGARLQMTESIELTIQSMQAYGPEHDHWVVAWSGGKDSSATLTLLVWLIASARIKAEAQAIGEHIDLIDEEEEARIRHLIATETWPDGWDGTEPTADTWLPVTIYGNGAEQHDLFALEAA